MFLLVLFCCLWSSVAPQSPVNSTEDEGRTSSRYQAFQTEKYYLPGQQETFSQPDYFLTPGNHIIYSLLVDYEEGINLACQYTLPCASGAYVKVTNNLGTWVTYCDSGSFSLTSTTIMRLEFYSGNFQSSPPPGYTCRVAAGVSGGCKCGQVGRNKIVGGSPVSQGEMPWDLAIYNKSTHKQICGATVISHWYSLTAAHCTHLSVLNDLYLYGGSVQLSDPRGLSWEVQGIQVHPEYDIKTQRNDISLLRTATPMRYTPLVYPICLPHLYQQTLLVGATATYSGWGTLSEGGESPKILQKVDVTVVSNEECLRVMRSRIYDTSLCTTGDRKDACQGDSGGLLSAVDNYKVTYQIGVVSFGDGCARPNRYGVNTRVSKYLDWIQQNSDVCFKTSI